MSPSGNRDSLRSVRALVTGGGGRLGNVLVRSLLKGGHQARVLEPRRGQSLDDLDCELIEGSVLDRDTVERAVRGVDLVFHLAAMIDLQPKKHPMMHAINVDGTSIVADACLSAGVRMVHTSSHAALDREPLSEPLTEENPLALDSKCLYHRSKAIAEQLVLDRCENGLDAVIVNPGSLIGPYDYEPSLIGSVLLDLYFGRVPVLLDALTDYADVRDVVHGMINAAQRGRQGERYFLTGDVIPAMQMVTLFGELSGRKMPSRALPLWVGWAAMPFALAAAALTKKPALLTPDMLRASVSNEVVSHEKAARELDFRLRPLRDSLFDALAWYEQQGWLSGVAERTPSRQGLE